MPKLYSLFYKFWNELKNYKIIDIFSNDYTAIIKKSSVSLKTYNFNKNCEQVLDEELDGVIDSLYDGEMIVIVKENYIKIVDNSKKELINPEIRHIFLKARFITEKQSKNLVTLSTNKSNSNENKISIFKINDGYKI